MELAIIRQRIYEIRGQKVMLDRDLALLYEVPTKSLNLAVKRNIDRFPKDFRFQLTKMELENLRFQNETSRWGGSRYLPFAFTELGVSMLSSVLNSWKAIQMNINIMRAFVTLKQFAITYSQLAERIARLERKYNKRFKDVYEVLDLLISEKKNEKEWNNRARIGFGK